MTRITRVFNCYCPVCKVNFGINQINFGREEVLKILVNLHSKIWDNTNIRTDHRSHFENNLVSTFSEDKDITLFLNPVEIIELVGYLKARFQR